jgi:hypothetical protein
MWDIATRDDAEWECGRMAGSIECQACPQGDGLWVALSGDGCQCPAVDGGAPYPPPLDASRD